MRRLFPIIICVVLFPVYLKGQQSPYKAGEKISWVIRYGPFIAGTGSVELKKETYEGLEVLHSYLIAQTSGAAEAFFKLRDIYESWINPVTELPVKSLRDVHEGRYKRYNIVLFDHVSRKDSAILTSDLTGKHVTQKGIHDILSCVYYFRKNYLAKDYPFKKDEIVTMMTWFCDELYPIHMVYKGTDEVKTRAGRIKCYKFNPVTEVGRLFKTNEDVTFWFSADKNYLPVKIRFDIFVGAFIVDLLTCEGLVDPLEIKKR